MARFYFFSDAFYPDWTGGLQRYATELAVEAASQGHHGALWTREWRPSGLHDVAAEVGEKFTVFEVFSWMPRRFRGVALLAAGFLGMNRMKANAEIAVFHTAIVGGAFMRRKSKTRQVYVFHASAGHELLVEAAAQGKVGLRAKLKAALLFHLERKCVRAADVVIVLSEFSRSLLETLHPRHAPKHVVVVPGGTRVPELGSTPQRIGSSRSARRIVVLRRLEWRMGIDILLRAFASSVARQQGWVLDVIGTGSQESALRSLAQELELGEDVVFHGRVSEEKRLQLLDDASLSVLPTRALEGFGLATVEAMARGIVPIVTTAGASPELVRDISQRLVCEPTVESMRDAIDHWAADSSEELLRQLGETCRAQAQQYDWKTVFTAYEAILQDSPKAVLKSHT